MKARMGGSRRLVGRSAWPLCPLGSAEDEAQTCGARQDAVRRGHRHGRRPAAQTGDVSISVIITCELVILIVRFIRPGGGG